MFILNLKRALGNRLRFFGFLFEEKSCSDQIWSKSYSNESKSNAMVPFMCLKLFLIKLASDYNGIDSFCFWLFWNMVFPSESYSGQHKLHCLLDSNG